MHVQTKAAKVRTLLYEFHLRSAKPDYNYRVAKEVSKEHQLCFKCRVSKEDVVYHTCLSLTCRFIPSLLLKLPFYACMISVQQQQNQKASHN